MSESKPVRCQKCGKPVEYITLLIEGLMGIQQPIHNVKIVAICMECFLKVVITKSTLTRNVVFL